MSFQNPVPGDENFEVCVMRQLERGNDETTAQRVCGIMGMALKANGAEGSQFAAVVPVVLTKEGVHNGRFKPWNAIKEHIDRLLNAPFFINQENEHVDGVFPDVGDKTRHHGYILEVVKDEKTKTVTGTVGLLTPETLIQNGASKERVEFQRSFLDALKAGGKFAVSIFFGAKVVPEAGEYEGIPYTAKEEIVVPNSLSLVPRGAESTAIMNGYLAPDGKSYTLAEIQAAISNSSKLSKAQRAVFANVAAQAVANGELKASAVVGLNTASKDRMDSTMPDDDTTVSVQDMSLTAVRERNAEVNKAFTEYEQFKASANADKAESDKLKSDVSAARTVLANVLDPENTETILSQHSTLASLANAVKAKHGEVAGVANRYVEAERKTLTARKGELVKALGNAMTPDEIAAIERPNDLPGTVKALEILANKLVSGEITPPADDLGASANLDQETAPSTESAAFEGLTKAFAPTPATKEA